MNINGAEQLNGAGQPPKSPQWDLHAPVAIGALIGVEQCEVQFVGRHPLLMGDHPMTVPVPVLLAAVGPLLSLLGADDPRGAQLRAAMAAAKSQLA